MLYINNAPFYCIAGEVHNSDSSSPEYMEKIWKIADDLGLNTLLLPVTWELTEPVEGTFNFSIPDALIRQARTWNKKIIFLWFGSWKNAQMMYAPEWIKRDLNRFRRAEIVKGEAKSFCDMGFIKMPSYSISYLCEEARIADAKAFAAQVPSDFATYMKAHTDTMVPDVRAAVENDLDQGTWREVFGPLAEEIFSAYYVAGYVGYVAEKGLAEYRLPSFANCWLNHKGDTAGQYPSGGPTRRMHEVWRFRAPMIDVLCPDIYVPEFLEVCDAYSEHQPLFIPEAATHSYAAPRLAYCIGHYHAMCYSPFGFDDIGHPFTMVQGFLFGMDVTNPALQTPQDFDEYSWFAKTLCSMMPLFADKYGTDALQAISAEQKQEVNLMDFGKLRIAAAFQNPYLPMKGNGVILAVKVSEEEYYILCYQSALSLLAGDADNFDILELEEGCFENGVWKRGRRLNGDEGANLAIEDPKLLRLKIHTYNHYSMKS